MTVRPTLSANGMCAYKPWAQTARNEILGGLSCRCQRKQHGQSLVLSPYNQLPLLLLRWLAPLSPTRMRHPIANNSGMHTLARPHNNRALLPADIHENCHLQCNLLHRGCLRASLITLTYVGCQAQNKKSPENTY